MSLSSPLCVAGNDLTILKMLYEDSTTGEYVFTSIKTGSKIPDMQKGFGSACRDVGIVNFTF